MIWKQIKLKLPIPQPQHPNTTTPTHRSAAKTASPLASKIHGQPHLVPKGNENRVISSSQVINYYFHMLSLPVFSVCVCLEAGNDSRGSQKDFSRGTESGEISFHLLVAKKTTFLRWKFHRKMSNFNIQVGNKALLALPFRRPCLQSET